MPLERSEAPADQEPGADPDVLLDVPTVKVDRIDLEVEQLKARVALDANVLQLLELNVGADVELGRVALVIEGVEAEALLKVRLDTLRDILERVFTTIDNNPQLIERLVDQLGAGLTQVGAAADHAVGALAPAVTDAERAAREQLERAARGDREPVDHAGGSDREPVDHAGRSDREEEAA